MTEACGEVAWEGSLLERLAVVDMIDRNDGLQLGVGFMKRFVKTELYNDSSNAWSCVMSSKDIGWGNTTCACSSEIDSRLFLGACSGAVNQRGSTGKTTSAEDCLQFASKII